MEVLNPSAACLWVVKSTEALEELQKVTMIGVPLLSQNGESTHAVCSLVGMSGAGGSRTAIPLTLIAVPPAGSCGPPLELEACSLLPPLFLRRDETQPPQPGLPVWY